jgi:hypothetical protein
MGGMNVEYPGFGRIIVDGVEYDHDVVIEAGAVTARSKKPSKPLRSNYGHTPLSAAEAIPWSHPRLVIGSGYSGRLPITPDVHETARAKGITIEVMPTSEACAVLRDLGPSDCNAILHVTC